MDDHGRLPGWGWGRPLSRPRYVSTLGSRGVLGARGWQGVVPMPWPAWLRTPGFGVSWGPQHLCCLLHLAWPWRYRGSWPGTPVWTPPPPTDTWGGGSVCQPGALGRSAGRLLCVPAAHPLFPPPTLCPGPDLLVPGPGGRGSQSAAPRPQFPPCADWEPPGPRCGCAPSSISLCVHLWVLRAVLSVQGVSD